MDKNGSIDFSNTNVIYVNINDLLLHSIKCQNLYYIENEKKS